MSLKRVLLVLPWLVAVLFATLYFSKQPTSLPRLDESATGEEGGTPTPTTTDETLVLVTRVVDGDTIEIEDKTRVRYIGIDTPERDQCFGSQATQANKSLVAGKKVRVETDIQKLDKYQRTLAYVWVGNAMVNEELVAQGFATVSTFPPNVRYVDRFTKAQQQARQAQLGLWAPDVCKKENQTSTPEVQPQTFDSTVQSAQAGCEIKGNISSSGEKIYHVPGQRYYDRTKIEESQGERFFCSEEEAQSAGWRKSKV